MTDISVAFSTKDDLRCDAWFSEADKAFLDAVPFGKARPSALARIAAKKAASAFFSEHRKKTIHPKSFFIGSDSVGRPILSIDGVPQDVSVSLSHVSDAAMAAVGDGHRYAVGADIESIRPFDEVFARRFLDRESFLELQCAPEDRKSESMTLQWVLREAFLKALGIGLREPPNSLFVRPTSSANRYIIGWSEVGVDFSEAERLFVPEGLRNMVSSVVRITASDFKKVQESHFSDILSTKGCNQTREQRI